MKNSLCILIKGSIQILKEVEQEKITCVPCTENTEFKKVLKYMTFYIICLNNAYYN